MLYLHKEILLACAAPLLTAAAGRASALKMVKTLQEPFHVILTAEDAGACLRCTSPAVHHSLAQREPPGLNPAACWLLSY